MIFILYMHGIIHVCVCVSVCVITVYACEYKEIHYSLVRNSRRKQKLIGVGVNTKYTVNKKGYFMLLDTFIVPCVAVWKQIYIPFVSIGSDSCKKYHGWKNFCQVLHQ